MCKLTASVSIIGMLAVLAACSCNCPPPPPQQPPATTIITPAHPDY